MAFNVGSIVAHLKLDTAGFSAGVKRATAQAEAFSAKIVGGFKKIQNVLALGGITVAAGFAAKQVGQLAKETFRFVNEGARLNDLSAAFERVAASAGESGTEVKKQVRAVTSALTDRDIERFANQLELLGVGIERLPRLTQIARAASIGLGQDLSYMLESISTGTARQSRLWLDNLGIIISVEQANRDYAKTLGKTAGELTDLEQRAAFVNAVLEKGGDIIDKVGAKAQSQGEKITNLAVAWTNLGDAIKKAVANSATAGGRGVAGPLLIQKIADFINTGGLTPEEQAFWAKQRILQPNTGNGLASPDFREWRAGQAQRQRELEEAGRKAAQAEIDAFAGGIIDAAKKSAGAPRFRSGGVAGRGIAAGLTGRAIPSEFGNLQDIGIDQNLIETPPLTFGDDIAEQAGIAVNALTPLGDAVESLFSTLIVDSSQAAKAFGSALLSGIGQVAGRMGDFLIQAGIGMEALKTLKGAQAIIAGLALKAIAGLFSGGAYKNAPNFGPSSVRSSHPRLADQETGPRVEIHVDNFIGNKAFINDLMRQINSTLRQGGHAEVFFAA